MTNSEIMAEAARIREEIGRLDCAMTRRADDAPVVTLLQNEVVRLRNIIDEAGMNYEPHIPEPEQFGPITEAIWHIQQVVARSNEWCRGESEKSLAWLSGGYWDDAFAQEGARIGSSLRIRLPESFEVKQS